MEIYSSADPHPAEQCLPTLTKLGNPTLPDDLNVQAVATTWLEAFERHTSSSNAEGVLDLIIDSSFRSDVLRTEKEPQHTSELPLDGEKTIPAYWRDVLALTWDYRTFEGTTEIRKFLASQLSKMKISNVKQGPIPPSLEKPFPDLAWIQIFFTFETEVGFASGIVRLLPLASTQIKGTPASSTNDLTWKALLVFTTLEGLKGHPENVGSSRNPLPNHGKWEEERRRQVSFEDRDPTALVIGGGHNGLNVAARLKALGVDTLIVEQNERLGDNWRTRYDALSLHTTVWHDHMSYLPFPPTWPVYPPAKKLANWLETYAEALELNVWTSCSLLKATQDSQTKIWSATIRKADGSERVMNVKYIVLATGLKGGKPYMPEYPGVAQFRGQILHSMEHKSARDHVGKRVVVVGSGSSAHDVCAEYVEFGVDVTMIQRSSTYVMSSKYGMPVLLGSFWSENGPPAELADMISASFPLSMTAGVLHRAVKVIAELDRETLQGLEKVGFKLNMGFKDTGLFIWLLKRSAGYYIDIGASQYIIDKKIKLKNDSHIKELTESGVKFENGDELPADVVVFATGFSDIRQTIRDIFGDGIADNVPQIFGLDQEGERQGLYKEIGYRGLYVMMGDFADSRFFSKHVAFQIKAAEEGLLDENKQYSKVQ